MRELNLRDIANPLLFEQLCEERLGADCVVAAHLRRRCCRCSLQN